MPFFQPTGEPGRPRGRLLLNIAMGLVVAVAGTATLWYALGELRSGQPRVASVQSRSPSATAAMTTSPSATHTPSPAPTPTNKPTAAPAPVHAPATPHIMLIVEENNSYSDIIGNAQLPYINSLAKKYGVATNWWALSHPSLPNYLAMISGSTWGNPADTTPQQNTYPGPTLVDELAAKHIAWKAYLEDMPVACDLKDTFSPGAYDVNHNPFMYFASIRNNPAQCNRVVPFTRLAGDLAANTAPPFIYVAPNTNIVIAANDHGARLSAFGNHYGLLRALEQAYGVGLLRGSASAANGNLKPLF